MTKCNLPGDFSGRLLRFTSNSLFEPRKDVRVDLRPVDLVEHLVPSFRIQANGHMPDSRALERIDAGKHAFEGFLDCVALDDGLVQYLMEVLQKRDWKEFYKLSQITTKLDLDPEEFLYWLGNKELDADEEERSCAGIMDAGLERLRQEGQLQLMAALLSGDRRTFELFRCQAPELQHLPAATYEWYSKNYLDRDYPIRMLMKCRGIRFPEHIPGNESK